MMRSRRGLTLIEVLAALALLGLLSAALSSWLQISGAFITKAAVTLPWESAAEQVMQRIQDDLLVGDFGLPEDEAKEPRCIVVDGRLTIRTRNPWHGATHCEYHFESSAGRLDRVSRPAGGSSQQTETRPLLANVAAWTCELHPEAQRLTVSLTSTTGRVISRSFPCPP